MSVAKESACTETKGVDQKGNSRGYVLQDCSKPVYIVTECPEVLRILGTMLSREGWMVHPFESPTKFLGQLAELPRGVAVVDQLMGEMDGIELLQHLSSKQQDYRAILINSYPRTSMTVAALRMGAWTVLDKPVDRRELLNAVAEASLQVWPGVEEKEGILPPPLPDGRYLIDQLTPREKQVILSVFRGWKNKAIALQLDLSIKTIEKFRSRAMRKLGVRSTALLVRVLTREIERGCRLE